MASPFTVTSVSNYNSNPPSDDGAQTAANRVQWSTQKTKLSDPIKTAFDTSESNTSTAFGKVVGGAGITTTAISYAVTASDQGKIVKATASGITITTPDATVVGSPFVFFVLNNSTGDITLDGSGTQTVDGSLTVTIPLGCGCMLNTDGSNWYTSGQNFNNVQQHPQGRLTLASATPVISSDLAAKTAVYYTPFIGDRVAISTDGATFKMRQFSELTLTLVANHLASTIYDVFMFDNAGTITIGTGPAWNNSTAGSCARGVGAGTTELQRLHGMWTNKNSMTARNGATTYTVAANQGLYVGSISIDSSAGQVSCYVSAGQSRKWGVWNAFNRVLTIVKLSDGTASWTTAPTTWRQSRGDATNTLSIFSGLADDFYDIQFIQLVSCATNGSTSKADIGIGVNSTTSPSGKIGEKSLINNAASIITPSDSLVAYYGMPPSLGINNINAIEQAPSGTTNNQFSGTETNMVLAAKWMT